MYTPQKTNPTISSLLFLRWTPHYTTPPCALAHSLLLVAMVLLVVAAVLVDGRAIPGPGATRLLPGVVRLTVSADIGACSACRRNPPHHTTPLRGFAHRRFCRLVTSVGLLGSASLLVSSGINIGASTVFVAPVRNTMLTVTCAFRSSGVPILPPEILLPWAVILARIAAGTTTPPRAGFKLFDGLLIGLLSHPTMSSTISRFLVSNISASGIFASIMRPSTM